jgi:hypothetical protein
VYSLIYEEKFPRISQELQNCLHLATKSHIGDWFLFKKYKMIRIYGSEEKLYILSVFLTPSIFALEVLRQRLHSYLVHLASRNQTSSFKVPITLGPFIVKHKSIVELIDDIMACFGFQEEPSCQYDPYHIISDRRKKHKRNMYDHKGTYEMEKVANKLALSSEDEESDDVEEMDTTSMITVDDKGKRPMEITESNVVDKKAKKTRLVKEPFLQVVEYPTPNMTVDEGKTIDTKKNYLSTIII